MTIIDVLFDRNFLALDNISRFNKSTRIKDESVSQHSHWVTTFTYLICESALLEQHSIEAMNFKYKCVSKAIFHDFDEGVGDDVSFDLKYNSFNGDNIRREIDAFVKFKIKEQYEDEGSIGQTVIKSCEEDQENLIYKAVYKLADWLACIKYETQELALGNRNMKIMIDKSISNLSEWTDTLQTCIMMDFGIKALNKQFFDQIKEDTCHLKKRMLNQ